MNTTTIDRKRVFIYIGFAFGLSWLTALVIYLRGGLVNSAELVPGTNITEALILVATLYMFSPAIAHVLTRLVTREGWKHTYLRPHFRQNKRFWLIAWLGTAGLIIISAIIYFLIFPQYFDGELSTVSQLIADLEAQTGQPFPFSPAILVVVQVIQAVLLAPILNLIPIFGEEFGWRAYLQPKLLPLGWRKAMIWMGVIWGLWHAPIIMMGHNYGLDYPGAPWLGVIVFTWFTFVGGVFLGWVTLRGGSVWPAVIGHAVLNGLGPGVLLLTAGTPNPLLGSSVAGLLGSIGFTVVGLWLLLKNDPLTETAAETAANPIMLNPA